ncbi:hypothetical protein GGR52DRAFT_256450 [Hypoxylon sp. FL1284]|nr:hypothetical protein GGR52DRAFT_256450 [Hypoxylon sp. FL1284]
MSYSQRLDITLRYMRRLRSVSRELPDYFENVARYLLCVATSPVCRHVILVERPYQSGIHPYLFSAMSYDETKSGPTPSTVGMARLVSREDRSSYEHVERWFRDSWCYYSVGVFLLNVCFSGPFDDVGTFAERVYFMEYLKSLLLGYLRDGTYEIQITCVGLKSYYVGRQVVSSLGVARSRVSLRDLASPVMVLGRGRDDGSHLDTFEERFKPKTVQQLCQTIFPLLELDRTTMSGNNAKEALERAVTDTNDIMDRLNSISSALPPDDEITPMQLRDAVANSSSCMNRFSATLTTAIIELAAVTQPKPQKSYGKAAAYGKRETAKRETQSSGLGTVSITASTPSVSSRARSVVFADSDDDTPPPKSTNPPTVPQSRSVSTGSMVVFDSSDDDSDRQPGTPKPSAPMTLPHQSAPSGTNAPSQKPAVTWSNEALLEAIEELDLADDNDRFLSNSYEYMTKKGVTSTSGAIERVLERVRAALVKLSVINQADFTPAVKDKIVEIISEY